MTISFIAGGDAFITRALPKKSSKGFDEIRELISKHDAAFLNLEMTFHNEEGYPAAASGGTWAMTDPHRLDDLLSYGFNLFSTANNHSTDYGSEGVLATMNHLRERRMVFSGTGENLSEARAPCYLETPEARIALISVTSTFDPAGAAGSAGADHKGRPGLNPLRFKRQCKLKAEKLEDLKSIVKLSEANAVSELLVELGYRSAPVKNVVNFGGVEFVAVEDGSEGALTVPNESDLKRICAEIKDARSQADIVLVSLHAHEPKGKELQKSAAFIEEFCRRVIDEGADAVIGHGPHMLRGIEIYRGKPIFYSLGNFIFETETVLKQPADAYLCKGLPFDTRPGHYMNLRSKNGQAGYPAMKEVWSSVLASWTMENGKISEIKLYPLDLGQRLPRGRRGVPEPAKERAQETLETLRKLSAPYGTDLQIENGVGLVKI